MDNDIYSGIASASIVAFLISLVAYIRYFKSFKDSIGELISYTLFLVYSITIFIISILYVDSDNRGTIMLIAIITPIILYIAVWIMYVKYIDRKKERFNRTNPPLIYRNLVSLFNSNIEGEYQISTLEDNSILIVTIVAEEKDFQGKSQYTRIYVTFTNEKRHLFDNRYQYLNERYSHLKKIEISCDSYKLFGNINLLNHLSKYAQKIELNKEGQKLFVFLNFKYELYFTLSRNGNIDSEKWIITPILPDEPYYQKTINFKKHKMVYDENYKIFKRI